MIVKKLKRKTASLLIMALCCNLMSMHVVAKDESIIQSFSDETHTDMFIPEGNQTVSGADAWEEDTGNILNTVSGGNGSVGRMQNDIFMKGTNSFGTMLANEFTSEISEQKENNGSNVFSVEIQDETAIISFESVKDAVLIVGIYDEAGGEMLTSGSVEVSANEKLTTVDFPEGSVPQYFYVRGFLVDAVTSRPLCTVYESPMYTQEMQDFLSKTVDDFDADRVLNLDEDITNNFAVFGSETILIPENSGYNEVVAVDGNNNTYIIENIDESITSLQPGDIFSYRYAENDLLIVKVSAIYINGTTAAIMGEEASMDEVFDYVKIDAQSGSEEAVVDTSTCADGVIYEGLVDYAEEDATQPYANSQGSVSKAFRVNINEEFGSIDGINVKISGGLDLKLTFSAKIYFTLDRQYVELKLDYSARIFASLTGQAKAEIPLITVGFMFTGIIVEMTPSLVLDAKASISLEGTLSGTIGFRAQVGEGITNLTTVPRFKPSIKIQGSLFFGFSLEPRVKILSEKVASASFNGQIGAELSVSSIDHFKTEEDKRHTCSECIAGEVSGKYSLTAGLKLVNKWNFDLTILENKFKIFDFFYSLDRDEFGLSTCPYYLYKGKVIVKDFNFQPIQNASIQVAGTEYTTNENGVVELWLPAGTHLMSIQKERFSSVIRELVLKDGGTIILVTLSKKGASGGSIGGNPEGGDSGTGGNPEYDGGFAGGDGTKENPYQVATAEQLNAVRNDMGACYQQVANIDLSGWNWKPIGYVNYDEESNEDIESIFGGEYDGNGYKIWNMTIRLDDCNNRAIGLFGKSCGKIENVIVENCDINLNLPYDGGRGHLIGGIVGESSDVGIVDNCMLTGRIRVINASDTFVGGITGHGRCSNSINYSNIIIQGNGSTYQLRCGGIAGYADNDSPIAKCINYGNIIVDSNSYTYCGGIVADAFGANITECTNYGNIFEDVLLSCDTGWLWGWAGGITGHISGCGETVVNCINYGDVVTKSNQYSWSGSITCAGGIVGEVDGPPSRSTKLIGNNNFGKNIRAVELGRNQEESYGDAGRIIGNLFPWGSYEISNCYSIGETLVNGEIPVENIGHNLKNGATIATKEMADIKFSAVTSESDDLSEDLDTVAAEEAKSRTESNQEEIILQNEALSGKKQHNWNGISFIGLIPDETYNYYVLKSAAIEQLFDSANLFYIGQAVSDENGTLNVAFTMKDAYADAEIYAVPMHFMDLTDASVSVSDLTYNGGEQYAEVSVIYDGITLTEGIDYLVGGDYGVTQEGCYTLTVRGTGMYTGMVSVSYKVLTGVKTTTVSGTTVSHGNNDSETLLQLLDRNESVIASTGTIGNRGNYEFQNVKQGDYIIRVIKQDHVTRDYAVTVENQSVILNVEIWNIGDVNGDGRLDARDKRIIYNHMASPMLTGYEHMVGDVNRDGRIDARDKRSIYNHIAGTVPLW